MSFPEKRDSDSGNSPYDDEKNEEKNVGVHPGGFETLNRSDLPLDPDAELSDEEKAKIVCEFQPCVGHVLTLRRIGDCCGSWIFA